LREPGELASDHASSSGATVSLPSFFYLSLLYGFLAVLPACKPSEESRLLALIGAVLIDGSGSPPLSNSVILIAGSRVRAVGQHGSVPIPAGSEKLDGSGKFVIPGLIDVEAPREGVASVAHADDADDARRQVNKAAERHATALVMEKFAPAVAEAVLEESRKSRIRVLARITTRSEVEFLLGSGAAGFLGMIQDTTELDALLINRLRDLRAVFAPELTRLAGPALEAAKRNTIRLAAGGVPIAVGSSGGAITQREMEMLADAGLAPDNVLAAATRNGALALGKSDEIGTLQAGRRADLIVLSANPLEDIRNVTKKVREMRGGEWVEERR
jgi:imidazolonepropionase-like amidohydrolase